MAKTKKKKEAFIPETTKAEVVPKDLQDKWSACEAVATAFNVLDKGYFPHSYAAAIKQSLGFLAKLHEQTVENAKNHPQAHMIPELKELLAKGKTDGQSNVETTAN